MVRDDPDFSAAGEDFQSSNPSQYHGKGGKGKRKSELDEGGPARKYLKPYETLPVQLLNAYTAARWVDMSDHDVWDQVRKPLRSGAMRPLSIRYKHQQMCRVLSSCHVYTEV